MFVLFLPIGAWAQLTVTGTVTDDTNFPLPGASILVKGTTKGEVTNIDGRFTISLDKTPATLIISYIGYVTKEVSITNQTTINITLETNQEQLDEVVVIGYGEVDKKDLTGSVTSLEPQQSVVNQAQGVESLLQGRAAGVLVSANSNEPGATTSIKIRGTNSLTSNTEPLYVIDGIIMDSASEDTVDPLQGGNSYLSAQNGITGVNPRDIEDIVILKDASATAIYGSRGANGVIIITTKKGKSGKAKFSYSTTTRIGTVTNDIEVLNTDDYIAYQNETRTINDANPKFYVYPDGSYAVFTNSEEYMLENSDNIARLEGINWSDDTYKSSVSTNHRITASGGSENGNYYFAGGYTKTEGVVPRAFAKSVDFNANLNNDLTDKLKLSTKISAFFGEYSASKGTEDLGGNNSNMVRQIISGAPILDYGDNFFGDTADFDDFLDGPRAWISDYDDLAKEIRLLGALTLDYKISKVFTYNVKLGTDYRSKERKLWYGTGIFRGNTVNGEAGIAHLSRFRYNLDNTIRFNKRFNKNHRLNGTVGVVIDQRFIQQESQTASGFPIKDLRADGISNGEVVQQPFFNRENESLLSFLGRINYTLYNKYLLTFSYRADGSSKFAKGNRWGHFPAVAFAWKINEENFLQNSETVTDLKLRLGWGLTGNQNIPNYRYLTWFDTTGTPYSDGSGNPLLGVVPPLLANPDLVWETTSQYNAGIDLGFGENRVTFTGDVFYKKITDLLIDVPIPPSNSYESFYNNQGSLINKGIELALSADIISTKNFKWNVYGNIAFIKNEIDDLGIPPGPWGTQTYSAFLGRRISGGNHFKVPANIFIQGKAPALFWGYATDGIVNDDSELANAPAFQGTPAQLGDVLLVDQNGDGNITETDLTIIGDPNPDFNYGFGSNFEFKGVSLSLFFNGVQGNDIANGNLLREGYASGANSDNIRTEAYFNAWRPDNPDGTYPRINYDFVTSSGFTDRIVEDGSFLRLSYVTLGYNIPVSETGFLDSASISVSGQNLLLFTNYSGFDPEVNSFSYDPLRVGVDWNSFPNQKSYSISLNLSF